MAWHVLWMVYKILTHFLSNNKIDSGGVTLLAEKLNKFATLSSSQGKCALFPSARPSGRWLYSKL